MPELAAGQVLAGPTHRYRLERELGRGGFGVTWRATREADGLVVALKQLHIARAKDPKSLELFRREIAVLRRLDHPNIPAYVDDFTHEGLVLVQAFVEGHALSEVVAGRVSMDEAGFVGWLAQILDVLVYLHRLTPPVIHRDITPKNILVGPDGRASLVDFGAVKVGLGGTLASTTAGTFGYAPMEQFVGKAFPQTDLYGLGMTAVAVAAGKDPEALTFKGMRVDVRSETRLDARLTVLLERLTEPDPERRLADAAVAHEQLRPLLMRYGQARQAAAGALQRLAEASRQAPTTRAQVHDDDLLPSERIREAGARHQALGGASLDLPPIDDLGAHGPEGIAFAGALVGLGDALIEADRMEVVARLPDGLSAVALTPDAECVVARAEEHSGSLVVLARTASGYQAQGSLPGGPTKCFAISPDGRSLAAVTAFFSSREGDVLLYDLPTRQLVQRFAEGHRIGGGHDRVAFQADGGGLACLDEGKCLWLLGQDGSEQAIHEVDAVAFSPDGRTVAAFIDESLVLGSLAELRAGRGLRRIKVGNLTRRFPCFSPAGNLLAAFNYSSDFIEVFDVETGKPWGEFHHPTRPGQRISGVEGIAFSPDGTRLLVACNLHFNRFGAHDEDCIAVWSLPRRRYLGALVQGKGGVLAVAAEGFFGHLTPPSGRRKGGTPSNESVWNRPDVARAALLDQPVDALIDERTRALLADLEARWAFFSDRLADGTLEPETALAPLIDATRGLTPLLDLVVREARAAQAAKPSFGGGAKGAPLTADLVRAAAQAVAARPEAERILAYEALVAEAAAAEEARARMQASPLAARAKKARAPTAVAQVERDEPVEPAARPAGPSVKLYVAAGIAGVVVALLLGLLLAR
jgi:WD40 repeat protein